MAENPEVAEIDKDTCPICFKKVDNHPLNCYHCLTCSQKVHSKCVIEWNHSRKPLNRKLSDDILHCPVCMGDSIAFCGDDEDMNAEIKAAVRENPNRRKGGRKSKSVKKCNRH